MARETTRFKSGDTSSDIILKYKTCDHSYSIMYRCFQRPLKHYSKSLGASGTRRRGSSNGRSSTTSLERPAKPQPHTRMHIHRDRSDRETRRAKTLFINGFARTYSPLGTQGNNQKRDH
jgi:hypothetical protein